MRGVVAKTGNQEAIAAVESYVGLFNTVHDSLGNWIVHSLSYIYKNCGADSLLEAMKGVFFPTWEGMMQGYWDMNFHDRLLFCVNAVKGSHDVTIVIEDEDDEKVTFRMDPCGSGERLYKKGVYDEPVNHAKCSPHPMTAGEDNFPCYCVHAPIGDMAAIAACGYPAYVQDYPEQVGTCSCLFVVYKEKENIPEKYFARLGLTKPTKSACEAR